MKDSLEYSRKKAGTGKVGTMRGVMQNILGLGRNVVVAYFEGSIPNY
jgi:hypothetical protein